MLNRVTIAVAGTVAAVLASPAFAGGPRYETKRLPMGGRADQYVMVRTAEAGRNDRPYALTGKVDAGRKEIRNSRYVPTHPKGTHSP